MFFVETPSFSIETWYIGENPSFSNDKQSLSDRKTRFIHRNLVYWQVIISQVFKRKISLKKNNLITEHVFRSTGVIFFPVKFRSNFRHNRSASLSKNAVSAFQIACELLWKIHEQ